MPPANAACAVRGETDIFAADAAQKPEHHMLTEEQVSHYHEQGYVFPDYRLPAGTLERIRADHDRLLADNPDRPEFRDNCSALLSHDFSFLNYANNPDILDMVEQLIGPDIALWNMSFFAKPAVNGKRTPWHQDGQYWPIRPLATCTVWIAVDDATRENAACASSRARTRASGSWRTIRTTTRR